MGCVAVRSKTRRVQGRVSYGSAGQKIPSALAMNMQDENLFFVFIQENAAQNKKSV